MPLRYDVLPRKAVEESAFDVELEWEVPWDFWEEKPEPPYEHPEQLRLFELEPPVRAEWLEQFDYELGKRGWPSQSVHAVYSYFDAPVENPMEDGEQDDPFRRPLMRFRVWIPGDWLLENPDFFRSFDELSGKGIRIQTNGDEGPYSLVYWRIYADRGPYEGETWEDTYFVVRKSREQAQRIRVAREEKIQRRERIRRGGWPRSVEWSPRGKLPGEV